MAFTEPMSAAEYQKKYGVPVNFDMPNDTTSRASHGMQASIFASADSAFDAVSKKAQKVTGFLGLNPAIDVMISHALRSKTIGGGVYGLNEQARQSIEKPTLGQTAGSALQIGTTVASPLIAPQKLGAQILTGAGLGYMYDVGSDLVEQKSAGEVATPGMATAFGAAAPPAIRGLMGASKMATPFLRQGAEAVMESAPVGAVTQTAQDVAGYVGRTIKKPFTGAMSQAEKASRARALPANARPAFQAGIDDVVIDLANNADEPTRKAMREMVQIAEQPKTARAQRSPADVASDTAVKQYQTIDAQRKNIGQQIGKISDELPTLRNIDVTPTQDVVVDVLKKNGITLSPDGVFTASDNMRVSDEQIAVLNKIWQKITSRQQMSAKNLHELDQWFSSTQRTSRVVDKIEDMYIKVPTPEGEKAVPIYKFLRDVFGQRLDEVAPDNLRALNKQYRQLSNITGDIEHTLVKTSNLETLQNADMSNPAMLRRMFSEAQSAKEFNLIYEQMDTLSRQYGYAGARADELYYVANKIRDYYPETIPETGLRKNIGASIKDAVGSIFKGGEITPADQQKALRKLLQVSQDTPTPPPSTATRQGVSSPNSTTKRGMVNPGAIASSIKSGAKKLKDKLFPPGVDTQRGMVRLPGGENKYGSLDLGHLKDAGDVKLPNVDRMVGSTDTSTRIPSSRVPKELKNAYAVMYGKPYPDKTVSLADLKKLRNKARDEYDAYARSLPVESLDKGATPKLADKRTYNLSNADDVEYLSSIFGRENVKDFTKEGFKDFRGRGIDYYENIAKGKIVKGDTPTVKDYGMMHRPTETGATASDISVGGAIPKDVYSHPEWYFGVNNTDAFGKATRESWDVVRSVKNKPNATITIYRASPSSDFNAGDWVTLSKKYADLHAKGQMPVHSKKVKAKDVQFAGDDINEFGYYPKD